MAIQILTRPQYSLPSGTPSRWNSAVHPIEYTGLAEPLNEETRPNYQLVFYLREAGTGVLLARSVRKPFKDGRFRFNVSPYVRKYFLNGDGTEKQSGAVNERDTGKSIEFFLEYQEIDDIAGEGPITSDIKTFFAVNAALQIPRPVYGQNMADFVAGIIEDEAEWLSAIDEPVMWEGYPFSLSFLYDPALLGIEVNKLEQRKDVNGVLINEIVRGINTNSSGAVNQLYIAGSLPSECRFVDVSLHSGQVLATPVSYLPQGYVAQGYVETIDP